MWCVFAMLVLWHIDLSGATCPEPEKLEYRVTQMVHRSELGYTQGLTFHEGLLYESTGGYGTSVINSIQPETGKVKTLARLDPLLFGEGLAIWKNQLVQLTWKEQLALIWSPPVGLRPPLLERRLVYPREAWGLTHDEKNWIASDGSATLRFLDPKSLNEEYSVQIYQGASTRDQLNELEYVNGKVYANIYKSDQIVRIDPRSRCVDAILDLTKLKDALSTEELRAIHGNVNATPNGIAYDSKSRSLYVTGKNWPSIFQIRVPDSRSSANP